ncbi:hypothetical protein FSC17_11830 [Acinetobacter indicus]|nr:hypothetical protein FSC17_11830 [Acinetobacter indicus]
MIIVMKIFYSDFWRTKFDFKDSLSAVGGLSGSASQLAKLTKHILVQQQGNILQQGKTPCANHLWGGCYGYAMDPYQATGQNFTIYNRPGHFPGVETDLFIDDQGGIFVSLRGASVQHYDSLTEYRRIIYDALLQHYQLKK